MRGFLGQHMSEVYMGSCSHHGSQGEEKRRDVQNVIRIGISPVLSEHLVTSRAEDRLAKDSGLH